MSETKKVINKEKSLNENACICHSISGLFIPNRQLSVVVASGILIIFVSFLGGYFFGLRHVADQFSTYSEQGAFADQIYGALYTGGNDQEIFVAEDNTVDDQVINDETVTVGTVDANVQVQQAQSGEPVQHYYAQLIGFGTKRAADRCAERLRKRGVPVTVRTRHSKTAKGRRIYWYQVVTESFSNKEELYALVKNIETTEKINGAQVLPC